MFLCADGGQVSQRGIASVRGGGVMRFKVTLEIEEWVEADSAKEAQLKFKDDFEWADIHHGTYHVEPDFEEQYDG
jgi:hypothetical protein